jgi:Delta7-sterol 5-desaturase
MQPILENFGKQHGILAAWIVLFLFIFIRYATFAGIAYYVTYVWKRSEWIFYKIQQKYPKNSQIREEITHSLTSACIFALMSLGVFFLRKMGFGELYFDISEHGYGYYFFTIAFMIVAHDTYFYWTHRLMHHPKLFRLFHLVHHESVNTTPWTSFSFHPLEAVVEFGVMPFIALLMPIHSSALLIFTVWSMAFNVMGHTGYEVFPKGATKHWFLKWFNTPTHHNMHHAKFGCNYGLYFNVWDSIMGTNHKAYHQTFDQVLERADNLKTAQVTPSVLVGNRQQAISNTTIQQYNN